MATTVRESIVQAFVSVQATFEEKDVQALEAKVAAKRPDKPAAYAFVIARNWAIERHRKACRDAARILRDERRAEEARREAERERLAREEFAALYACLAPALRPTQLRQLQIVNLVCIEGLSDAETARRYPGTTPAARWQWKRRGVLLLLPHATEALKSVIGERLRQR
jgi:DNA-directed RNA polymerase specialized sigma24 family protein